MAALPASLPEVINTRSDSVRSTAAQDEVLLVGRNLVAGARRRSRNDRQPRGAQFEALLLTRTGTGDAVVGS